LQARERTAIATAMTLVGGKLHVLAGDDWATRLLDR